MILLVCNALNISAIESLVIAYSDKESPEELLTSLKHLWTGVEEYVKIGKLSSVGLSDISTNVFIDLFQWATVRSLMFLYNYFHNIIYISLMYIKIYYYAYMYYKYLHILVSFYFIQIKPNIVQISLATCCVVPPALQAFTKENDVQLLTHNDPGRELIITYIKKYSNWNFSKCHIFCS